MGGGGGRGEVHCVRADVTHWVFSVGTGCCSKLFYSILSKTFRIALDM